MRRNDRRREEAAAQHQRPGCTAVSRAVEAGGRGGEEDVVVREVGRDGQPGREHVAEARPGPAAVGGAEKARPCGRAGAVLGVGEERLVVRIVRRDDQVVDVDQVADGLPMQATVGGAVDGAALLAVAGQVARGGEEGVIAGEVGRDDQCLYSVEARADRLPGLAAVGGAVDVAVVVAAGAVGAHRFEERCRREQRVRPGRGGGDAHHGQPRQAVVARPPGRRIAGAGRAVDASAGGQQAEVVGGVSRRKGHVEGVRARQPAAVLVWLAHRCPVEAAVGGAVDARRPAVAGEDDEAGGVVRGEGQPGRCARVQRQVAGQPVVAAIAGEVDGVIQRGDGQHRAGMSEARSYGQHIRSAGQSRADGRPAPAGIGGTVERPAGDGEKDAVCGVVGREGQRLHILAAEPVGQGGEVAAAVGGDQAEGTVQGVDRPVVGEIGRDGQMA